MANPTFGAAPTNPAKMATAIGAQKAAATTAAGGAAGDPGAFIDPALLAQAKAGSKTPGLVNAGVAGTPGGDPYVLPENMPNQTAVQGYPQAVPREKVHNRFGSGPTWDSQYDPTVIGNAQNVLAMQKEYGANADTSGFGAAANAMATNGIPQRVNAGLTGQQLQPPTPGGITVPQGQNQNGLQASPAFNPAPNGVIQSPNGPVSIASTGGPGGWHPEATALAKSGTPEEIAAHNDRIANEAQYQFDARQGPRPERARNPNGIDAQLYAYRTAMNAYHYAIQNGLPATMPVNPRVAWKAQIDAKRQQIASAQGLVNASNVAPITQG